MPIKQKALSKQGQTEREKLEDEVEEEDDRRSGHRNRHILPPSAMAEDKPQSPIAMAARDSDRDLLIPVPDGEDTAKPSAPSSSNSSSHHSSSQVTFYTCLSYVSVSTLSLYN